MALALSTFDLSSVTSSPAFAMRSSYIARTCFASPVTAPVVEATPPSSSAVAVVMPDASLSHETHRPRQPPQGSRLGVDPAALRARATAEKHDSDPIEGRPKWKVYRLCQGHDAGVNALAFDPSNEWFASASSDKTIVAWDLVTGRRRATLTGHVASVESIAVSHRSPYLFSAGQDRMVKAWDLEKNVAVRAYHGHLSAVHAVACHPVHDVIVSGGKDRTVRLWDLRIPQAVHVMEAHNDTVLTVAAQGTHPEIISGGADSRIVMWEIRSGRPFTEMTAHKKPVRALCLHPEQNALCSAAADNVRTWRLPTGEFMRKLLPDNLALAGAAGHRWCCVAVNPLGTDLVVGSDGSARPDPTTGKLVSGGAVAFVDWHSARTYQASHAKGIPGTVEGTGGIQALAFDRSGQHLVSGHGDKSIRFWSQTMP